MSRDELDPNDPNVAFGQDQGLFAYNMASSLTGETNSTIAERAEDAVRSATRIFERPEIDLELATSGLVAALGGTINVRE